MTYLQWLKRKHPLSPSDFISCSQALQSYGDRGLPGRSPIHFICQPDRVADVHAILEEELFNHAHIQLNLGTTQVWNQRWSYSSGSCRAHCSSQTGQGGRHCLEGRSRVASGSAGVKVLGTPIGQPEFVQSFLAKKSREHQTLFERIPLVEDLQSSWLLLLMCGATRANFWLRTVRPDLAESFAVRHDARVWQCVQSWTLLQRLRPSLSCHSSRGDWAWPAQCGGEPPLIGPVGLTASGW